MYALGIAFVIALVHEITHAFKCGFGAALQAGLEVFPSEEFGAINTAVFRDY